MTLAPIALPSDDPAQPCGNPMASSVSMLVTAYTQSDGAPKFTGSELDGLPADTLQFAVEISGAGGTPVAIGKTAPIAGFADLADGTVLPVAMLPPNGFCHAGDMVTPRLHPAIARAGAGVLVVGGLAGGSGAAAEYYDPATATFHAVDVPGQFASLDGAALATLPDGRVALSLGQGASVFDPSDQTFSPPSLLSDTRTDHVSVALDDTHVIVTGGCVTNGDACGSGDAPKRTSIIYQVDAAGVISNPTAAASLPPTSVRYDGTLFDPGPLEDGTRRGLLAGSWPDPTTGDALPMDASGTVGTVIPNMYADAVMLDGGGVLSAFAPDGSAQSGADSIVPPDVGASAGIAALLAPPLDGARLVLAEDGTVVAIGDATLGTFLPTTQLWDQRTPIGDVPPPLPGPALIRLPDGSVLVLGGGAAPSATTWLYRPSLDGPSLPTITALPGGETGVLTPTSPANTGAGGGLLRLTAPATDPPDAMTARALVGSVRTASGSIGVTASIPATGGGGIVLIAQQTAPGSLLDARLMPGETPVIERRLAGTITPLCSGGSITAEQIESGVGLAVTGTTATLTFSQAQTTVVSCSLANDPGVGSVGQWGVAATNGAIDVSSVTVTRGQ